MSHSGKCDSTFWHLDFFSFGSLLWFIFLKWNLCKLRTSIFSNNLTKWQTHTTINKIEWGSNCCVTPIQQFFSYIMVRASYISMRWWWCLLCNRPTLLSWIFMMLAPSNSSLQVDMPLHSATLFQANQSLLLLLNAMWFFNWEVANTNFIVFCLIKI